MAYLRFCILHAAPVNGLDHVCLLTMAYLRFCILHAAPVNGLGHVCLLTMAYLRMHSLSTSSARPQYDTLCKRSCCISKWPAWHLLAYHGQFAYAFSEHQQRQPAV
jgi:hypothetical protein